MSLNEEMRMIRRRMSGLEWEPEAQFVFRHPSRRWRSVIGHPDDGTRYGAMVQLYGGESSGKTARASEMAGMAANNDGAIPIWCGFEPWIESWQNVWGLYYHKPAPRDSGAECLVLEPYMYLDVKPPKGVRNNPDKLKAFIKKSLKTKEAQIATANRICDEAENFIRYKAKQINRKRPFVLVLDSIAAMNTTVEEAAGIQGQKMNTKLGLPSFLSQLFRRWAGFFATMNVLGIMINQTRVNPNQLFGNPETTPGGKALRFYSDTIIGLRRSKGGKVFDGGKQIGIQGVAQNVKNRLGGVEFTQTGYQIFFSGKTKHMSKSDLPKFKSIEVD